MENQDNQQNREFFLDDDWLDIILEESQDEKAVTLDDLSRAYGISKERVRQIELNSIKKIRKTNASEQEDLWLNNNLS